MGLFTFLIGASRRLVVASVLAGLVSGVAGVGVIALIREELAREASRPAVVGAAFFGLCIAAGLARVAAQVAIIRLGQSAVAGLGVHLVRRILHLPLRDFEAIDTSALLAVLTEDIAVLAGALVGLPHLCINIPIVVACLAYVGWLSPPILACGIAFAAPAIAAYVLLSARGIRSMHRARACHDAVIGHFRTAVAGFRELKLHRGRRAAYLADSLEPDVARARDEMVRGLSTFAIADGWGQTAFFAFIGLALFVVPQAVAVERPTLVSAVLVALYLMSPLDVILTWIPALGRARASLRKVVSLLPRIESYAEPGTDSPAPAGPAGDARSIGLASATFVYRDRHEDRGFALGPLGLTVRRGEIVILAGGNGSGKTTVVKLVSGLYRPDTGTARIDGHAVGDADRESQRNLFSVVFADGHLFADLRGLGDGPIDARARDGLERLGMASHVSVDRGAFSTLDLSQGQRRRLALLTAWIEDRPFCILDELAANQDPAFKQLFYGKLLPEMRSAGKGLLVISHDEEYFDVADRVVRLHEGRILDESPAGIGGVWR